jgi:hypothetical protein
LETSYGNGADAIVAFAQSAWSASPKAMRAANESHDLSHSALHDPWQHPR